MISTRQKVSLLALVLSLPALFVLDLFIGSASLSFSEVANVIRGNPDTQAHKIIILSSRLPKAITALLCGSGLAISGLLMQTLFRNPLAGPYILGISSGGGLGVALLIMGAGLFGLGVNSPLAVSIASMIGSVTVLLILFAVSIRIKDVMTLLILGIMIGSISTAIIGLLQYFTNDYQLKSFLIWTLGSLEGVPFKHLLIIGIITVTLIILALLKSKPMNALLLGEDYAKSLGVSITPLRLSMILISGGIAGLITAFCGPIGFVGVIIPHLTRLWLRSTNHLLLIPACILLGSEVLLLSDIISHLPSGGISLPINSITSIIGIPIILWIIFKKQSISTSFE